jgi:hypothetical protein
MQVELTRGNVDGVGSGALFLPHPSGRQATAQVPQTNPAKWVKWEQIPPQQGNQNALSDQQCLAENQFNRLRQNISLLCLTVLLRRPITSTLIRCIICEIVS